MLKEYTVVPQYLEVLTLKGPKIIKKQNDISTSGVTKVI